MQYRRMLEEGYEAIASTDPISRLEYLADYIFDFTTYDSKMGELFASKAMEVCAAISNRTTFDYIEDESQYQWFLLMVNMPFFSPRLNWGTSVRGAWWDTSKPNATEFDSCGLWLDGQQISEPLKFSTDDWREFIAAVLEFGSAPGGA